MQRRSQRRKKSHVIGKIVASLIILALIIGGGLAAYAHFWSPKNQASPKSQTRTSQTSTSQKQKSTTSSSSAKTSAKAVSPKWLTAQNQNQLPILMFHYVSGQASDLVDSNWMPTATFEADLQALQADGYTTLSGAEAEKVLTTKTKPSNKMVWLTFDDGSLTLYRDIFPLLKKYKMHATAFIITSFVDNNQSGILTWAQIKEMKDSGLVDFGSHSVSHLDLGTLSDSDATYQLAQSKKELDQQLDQKTNIICYPAGGYNARTLAISQQLGYQFGLLDPGRNGATATTAQASDGLMTLPRFRMSATSGPDTLMSYVSPAATYNAGNPGS